jgi:hypothetical protein
MTDSSSHVRSDHFARAAGSKAVVVGGIAVHPPVTERQARRLAPLGLLADDPTGLLNVWTRIEQMWRDTVDRALRLPRERLDERMDGEWSLLETLRHLVFVTDSWVSGVIRAGAVGYHRLGIPPDFVTNGRELGLDLEAHPDLNEVRSCRQEGMSQVRQLIEQLDDSELTRPCLARVGRFTVLGAIQVVIFEEWAHNQYASRDLTLREKDAEAE